MNRSIEMLTGIRFFAAFHVVLFHNLYLIGDIQKELPRFIHYFINKGESAVTLFFILSGFILTHVYRNKLVNFEQKKSFLWARVCRLYPLYLIGFLLDAPRVYQYFFQTYPLKEASLKFGVSGIFHLAMVQSWYPRLTPVWNSPAWSLSCEMFFYFMMALFFRYLFKRRQELKIIVIAYILTLSLFLILYFKLPHFHQGGFYTTLWRSFPLLRLLEFVIGINLYQWITTEGRWQKWVNENNTLIFWSGIFGSLCMTVVFHEIESPFFPLAFLTPFFSLVILGSYKDSLIGDFLFKNKVSLFLGEASYAVYILHQPLKNYLQNITSPSLGLFCLYVAIVLMVSSLAFKFIERPVNKALRRLIS